MDKIRIGKVTAIERREITVQLGNKTVYVVHHYTDGVFSGAEYDGLEGDPTSEEIEAIEREIKAKALRGLLS